LRGLLSGWHGAVIFVNQYYPGSMVYQLGFGVFAIGRYDQVVSYHDLASSGTVQTDLAAASRRLEGIRGEPFAIFDVVNLEMLELANASSFEERCVDPAGAFIVEICAGRTYPVKFRLKHTDQHGSASSL
jgi:hypothetical protein